MTGLGPRASGLHRLVLVLGLVLVLDHRAHAEPSNETLVYVGLAAAPVDYLAGVSLHEGSHALAAKLVGADVDEYHPFPPGIDPHTHTFRFGWTYVHGLHTRADRAVFYIAPKITDSVLLGGFAALVYTSAWPRNRYGELALTVAATGLWVDFAKDVVLLSPLNDVSQFERETCLRGWRRVASRVVYAAADVGLALVVAHGYVHTFERPATTAIPLVLPVLTAAF
ncbi:MAG: hypothetical protein ACM31C_15835 [Acidobacteriota bacterium]